MVRTTIRVLNAKKVSAKLRRMSKSSTKAFGRANLQSAQVLARDIRAHTPVDTGRLRRSTKVRYNPSNGSVSVGWFVNSGGTTPPHMAQALAVEYGNKYRPGRFVIRNALRRNRRTIRNFQVRQGNRWLGASTR